MGQLISLYSKYPFVIIAKGLEPPEWDLLNYYLRTQNVEIYYWERGRPEPYLHPNQILLTSEFSEHSLKMSYEWALPLSVIGRLSENETEFMFSKFVTSFWNVEKISIPYFLPLVGKTWEQKEIQVLLWSSNFLLAKVLQSMFRFFSIKFIFTENPQFAVQSILQNEYNLIILDWDNANLEILQVIRELKNLKLQKRSLPPILGIKDFNKMHIFKDLSSGIKEFCSVLFNEREVIELFLRSFPLSEKSSSSYLDEKEFPILRYAPKSYSSLYLDYKKDSRLWELKNSWTWKEIEQNLFKEQFQWILQYF